eukprot:TRINITY_DN1104_c0_g1_i4.p1 TRINITY_DN1104_c0_g1~~TRINITY_DN1104_c0_g1_i4.p1  ORF type:complete len:264 (+),score=80.17 TRINITY_DN1104_c0_g1_i4:68-793(+)
MSSYERVLPFFRAPPPPLLWPSALLGHGTSMPSEPQHHYYCNQGQVPASDAELEEPNPAAAAEEDTYTQQAHINEAGPDECVPIPSDEEVEYALVMTEEWAEHFRESKSVQAKFGPGALKPKRGRRGGRQVRVRQERLQREQQQQQPSAAAVVDLDSLRTAAAAYARARDASVDLQDAASTSAEASVDVAQQQGVCDGVQQRDGGAQEPACAPQAPEAAAGARDQPAQGVCSVDAAEVVHT